MEKKIFMKWRQLQDSAKSTIAFTISSLFIKGIAFIITPIFTRIMSTEQYGILAVYNSWNVIIEVFALLGLTSAGVFNTGLNDYRNNRDKYISTVLLLSNIQTIIVFVIIGILKVIIGNDFVLPNNLLIIMFIQFLFYPAQIFWITRQRYEYKYKLATFVSILSSLFSQLVAVVCICNISAYNSAEIKVWSSTLAGLFFSIPIYIILLKKGKCSFDRSIGKETLIFALPLIPHYLAQHIMSSSDRIMISDMVSETDAAIYSLASTVSLIATVIWGAINGSLTPYIFNKLNEKEYKGINSTVFQLIMGYAVICVVVSLMAPEVINILGTSDYYIGIYAIPPIAATSFLSAFYNIYATIEFYHKKSKLIAGATIVACFVNIILNIILIPIFGFVAAAYTTLISYIVLNVMHYIGYRKCQKDKIYNDALFLMLAIIGIVSCELCNLLYSNTIIRYIVIIAIACIAVIKRKKILEKIQMLKKSS